MNKIGAEVSYIENQRQVPERVVFWPVTCPIAHLDGIRRPATPGGKTTGGPPAGAVHPQKLDVNRRRWARAMMKSF